MPPPSLSPTLPQKKSSSSSQVPTVPDSNAAAHSRNSSATSQSSQTSTGYASQTSQNVTVGQVGLGFPSSSGRNLEEGHSRQSSSGDSSSHAR